MSDVQIEWNDSAWSQIFKSEGVDNALYAAAKQVADNATAIRHGHGYSPGSRLSRYDARTDRVGNTSLGTVFPCSRDCYRLAKAHPDIYQKAAAMTNVQIEI